MDVSTRLAVVVGGGSVAARKVRGLLEAGAGRIRCVALAFCAEMPEGVERVAQAYNRGHLEGAGLVFAATDRAEVNSAVVLDGQAMGLLVNRADADEEPAGDFSTPAMLRDGELLVTVSAGGNPALAAALRDEIAGVLGGRWGKMARAMAEIRPRVLASGLAIEERRGIFRDLASREAMECLESEGVDGLCRWLEKRHGAW